MKKILILFFILIVGIGAAYLWWQDSIQAVDKTSKKNVIFVIEKGQGLKETAKKLKDQGLIKNQIAFFFLTRHLGLEEKIQAGDFRLSPSFSSQKIAESLTHGSLDVWITIPEGKRAEEIGDILAEKIPQFTNEWRTILDANEGYLFPDTYLIPKDASVETIVSLMKNNFELKYAQIPKQPTTYTKNEIVTIASLIEREAKADEDRPIVASVIYNRLEIDMPLQLDATIQYLLGYQRQEKTWWKAGLTENDLAMRSAYNTYLHTGLPPTPIANPGLKVLEAAIKPAKTDYLYYIADKNGINRYGKTLEEHNNNIKKFGL